MAKTVIKKNKKPLTLEMFISKGRAIAKIYQDDKQEQAKAIGRYFDSVCRAEGR